MRGIVISRTAVAITLAGGEPYERISIILWT